MNRYDPLRAPHPNKWLALDEAERVALVEDYHRREHTSLPSQALHAACHVIVENQLAMHAPAIICPTLERLMQEGLDRHEAVHAIGMLVTRQLFDALKQQQRYSEQTYIDQLNALTAASYRAECEASAGQEFDDILDDDDEEFLDDDLDFEEDDDDEDTHTP